MKAKLARERKAWEAEQQRRREERMRIIREQQEEKERRWREIQETMREEVQQKQVVYEEQKALEVQLRLRYQQNQESIVQATRKSLDKVKALEEDFRARSIQARPIKIVIEFPQVTEVDTADEVDRFLDELRKRNPEWEERRQAFLQVCQASCCFRLAQCLLR